MVEIDNVLISDDLFSQRFVCDLNACKGECCVAGDAGAPLEEDELEILEQNWKKVLPLLPEEGRKALEKQGPYVKDHVDGDWVTPLRDGKECAYTVFAEDGTAQCGIELAWKQGKVDFQKPVSCHLYPVRMRKLSTGEAMNYDRWDICSPACSLGKSLNVKVYQFVKEALVRKYGAEFFEKMVAADDHLSSLEATSSD